MPGTAARCNTHVEFISHISVHARAAGCSQQSCHPGRRNEAATTTLTTLTANISAAFPCGVASILSHILTSSTSFDRWRGIPFGAPGPARSCAPPAVSPDPAHSGRRTHGENERAPMSGGRHLRDGVELALDWVIVVDLSRAIFYHVPALARPAGRRPTQS
jgi:hypothetical protein